MTNTLYCKSTVSESISLALSSHIYISTSINKIFTIVSCKYVILNKKACTQKLYFFQKCKKHFISSATS